MSTGWSSEWLDFAYMDLSAAEHLLTMRPLPVEIICYHCEQAAEKFLKATLVLAANILIGLAVSLELNGNLCDTSKSLVEHT